MGGCRTGTDSGRANHPAGWPPIRRASMSAEPVPAKAVGGGYCRLQMPLRLALGVRGTVAGHRLGALEQRGPFGARIFFFC